MATTQQSTVAANYTPEVYYYYEESTFPNYESMNEDCDMSDILNFTSVLTPAFLSVVVILSLLGNILVLVILVKYENLKSLINTFILNLAVSDLFFTMGLPFWAYYHIHGWTLGEPSCKIVSFIFEVGFYSGGILLIMMTVHRYVAVVNPLSNFVSKEGYAVIASVLIWAVSIFVASPAFAFTKFHQQNHHYYCERANSYWNLWGTYQQNVLFLITSVVFIFCYTQIMCRLLRPTVQQRKNKTLKLICALMVVFFVGWAPYNIAIFQTSLYSWSTFSHDPDGICDTYRKLQYTFYVSRLLAFSHCWLNPVFYVFVGVKFQNHLKKMMKCWRNVNHSSTSIRSRQSRLTITSVTSGEELSV